MKNLYRSLFTFAVVICFTTIIAGCSVGIRPAYYNLPPLDNNNYNYGESAYNQYNATSTSSDYRYDYSSTYNPWTMGNYYENYTPPQRSDNVQASTDSSNSPWVGDKRPVMKDRGTVTNSESKAPRDDSANLRRERAVQREKASKAAESSTSSIVNQKTRRNVRRDVPQGNQEQPSSQTNIKKENSEPSKSDNSKKDEEDKKKKKNAVN